MPTLYHIKPKNDGYHILGRSMVGEHFLISKDSKDIGWKGELIFKSKKEAQEYIDTHNLSNEYIPEKFWRIDREYKMPKLAKEAREMLNKANITIKRPVYCPDCGNELKWMVTVSTDESASGMSESLYHCDNDNCGSDFNLCRDANGNFIKMERYFFG